MRQQDFIWVQVKGRKSKKVFFWGGVFYAGFNVNQ